MLIARFAGELKQQIRREFESNSQHKEPYAIKYALSMGRDQLKQLSEMLAMMR